MEKDLLYCAIDVSKDKLDLDAANGLKKILNHGTRFSARLRTLFLWLGTVQLGVFQSLLEHNQVENRRCAPLE
jgi:hypothetical protein